MKHTNITHMPPRGRRIFGHAEVGHIQDPHLRQEKLDEGTTCPQCGVVFHQGRWHWAPKPAESYPELCSACHRIQDVQPAGVVTLTGPFARAHRQELIELARHQEQAEKNEHPMKHIMAIEGRTRLSSLARPTSTCRAVLAGRSSAHSMDGSTCTSTRRGISSALIGSARTERRRVVAPTG